MRDTSVIEPFAVQEFFADGFTNFHVADGVLRCVGYRLQPPPRLNGEPLKIAIIRLVMPANGAYSSATMTKQAIIMPTKGIVIAPRGKFLN